jgi:hypothetical protein
VRVGEGNFSAQTPRPIFPRQVIPAGSSPARAFRDGREAPSDLRGFSLRLLFFTTHGAPGIHLAETRSSSPAASWEGHSRPLGQWLGRDGLDLPSHNLALG